MTLRLCLALLLDASGSVPDSAWRLMAEAHGEALLQPAVVRAAADGIAIASWAFANQTVPMAPWRIATTREELLTIARQIAAAPRPTNGSTFTGHAVLDVLASLGDAPACEEHVIDVVTDGPGDDAPAAERARDLAQERGVKVNVLVVTDARGGDPLAWLRAHLLPVGSFAMIADGWQDFARAISRKVTLEVASR